MSRAIRICAATAAALAAACLTTSAPTAVATISGTQITSATRPPDVAAGLGTLAYSQPLSKDTYGIAVRRPGEQTATPLAIAPLRRPPTLEFVSGPIAPQGALLYPRCAGDADTTCKLAVLFLGSGVERTVPNTAGTRQGTMLRDLTFVFATVRKNGGLMLRAVRRGKSTAIPLPTLTVSSFRDGIEQPQRIPVPSENVVLSELTAHGNDIAYELVYEHPGGGIYDAEIWTQRVSPRIGKPVPVASMRTGGAASALRTFVGLRLQARSVTTYKQGWETGNAVMRYPRGRSGRSEQRSASLGQSRREEVARAAFDGNHAFLSIRPSQSEKSCRYPDGVPPGVDPERRCVLLDTGPLTLTAPKPRR